MCASCGCGEANESHGNPDNITMDGLERAASAAGISTTQVMENLQASVRG